jgi:hypothetical protein
MVFVIQIIQVIMICVFVLAQINKDFLTQKQIVKIVKMVIVMRQKRNYVKKHFVIQCVKEEEEDVSNLMNVFVQANNFILV